jgi:hypothetical protein
MNVRLHIERLVLDGVDGNGQPQLLQAAIEAELVRLLTGGGLAAALGAGGAMPRIALPSIELAQGEPAGAVGARIAGAVYAGVGR